MATHSSILAWRIPMNREARWATVHRVEKSQTQLSSQHTHTHIYMSGTCQYLTCKRDLINYRRKKCSTSDSRCSGNWPRPRKTRLRLIDRVSEGGSVTRTFRNTPPSASRGELLVISHCVSLHYFGYKSEGREFTGACKLSSRRAKL